MNVVLDYSAGPYLTARLRNLQTDGLTVTACPQTESGRFDALLQETVVLWHVIEPLTAAVIGGAPRLRLIQKIGVGVNTIDLDAAQQRDVAVCNMPGTNSQAVAEMTLLLMLATLRRLQHLDRATRAGDGWSRATEWQNDVGELSGKTIGLVGYGAVPRLLAPIVTAMGACVLFTSLTPKPQAVGMPRELDALLHESDIVSLHVPLTPDTTHLIDRDTIARMKPGAILINTARGALIDESALVAALTDGTLAAAGLDVFETEPAPAASPLLALDNVVATPHVAWLTRETLDRSLGVAVENCRRLAHNQDLLHRVV